MTDRSKVLLVCTVGGTSDQVVATLRYWKPLRIHFVCTEETRTTIAEAIARARQEGVDLDEGRWEPVALRDAEDLGSCLDCLRTLTGKVEEWVARGDDYQVVVDFTGGTKCMSAAVVLQARVWPCVFSYVGGSRRTKGGVGTVETGSEIVVRQENPWNVLGYQAVEEFCVLFDQMAFASAKQLADNAKRRVTRADRQREFAVLEHLASAFWNWDRFKHDEALRSFTEVKRAANDLKAVIGEERGQRVLGQVKAFAKHLADLRNAQGVHAGHVRDLLANALRRREEGRWDDAVARLYRAIEAVAQARLREEHGLPDSAAVPLDAVPEPLRERWEPRAQGGEIQLGLQDAYLLLRELGDPLGARFEELGLKGRTSPLSARNHSILAHGLKPISERDFQQLWQTAVELAGVEEKTLPTFPKLRGDPGESSHGGSSAAPQRE